MLCYSVRQMVMFSATWPPAVHQLAQEFMDPCPVKVWIIYENYHYCLRSFNLFI